MNTEAIRSDWVGRVIDGKYVLLKHLGISGSGVVFLTTLQEPSSRRAAIKLLPAASPHAEARFDAWAAAADLSHPHLMPLLDRGRCHIEDTEVLYAVTDYAEEDLSQVLPHRALTPAEAVEMLDPLVDALQYLHANGLVHGHIKPSNILVVDEQLKLSSDSLEAIGSPATHRPPSGIYDAPERSTWPISAASDVWSLGVTLVEALTQQTPAWGAGANQDPVVPQSIPEPFAEIAQQSLRQNPSRRCTLHDIQARLHPESPLPSQPPASAEPAPAPAPQPVPVPTDEVIPIPAVEARLAPARPRPALLVAAALVVIAIIAVIILLTHSHRTSSPAANQQQASQGTAPSQESEPSSPANPSTQAGTIKAEVAHQVLPDVPPSASATIWGTVVVKVRVAVDATGKVTSATFDSPGPSHYFAKLSLQAAQQWQFKPAQINGQPAPSVWLLEFQFTNTSTNVTPSQVAPQGL